MPLAHGFSKDPRYVQDTAETRVSRRGSGLAARTKTKQKQVDTAHRMLPVDEYHYTKVHSAMCLCRALFQPHAAQPQRHPPIRRFQCPRLSTSSACVTIPSSSSLPRIDEPNLNPLNTFDAAASNPTIQPYLSPPSSAGGRRRRRLRAQQGDPIVRFAQHQREFDADEEASHVCLSPAGTVIGNPSFYTRDSDVAAPQQTMTAGQDKHQYNAILATYQAKFGQARNNPASPTPVSLGPTPNVTCRHGALPVKAIISSLEHRNNQVQEKRKPPSPFTA
ncbi:hypothetical protein BGZ61DRAFT_196037 [Ilyonectria robusta]|uniref:uncharacterized protein n=1 Tax=Ilyonectria robusta TaxID=1079257 RepID=UPI001E8E285A|nr:uncharacterized protein BGZ61DRAFT_196037 [Ilyonectria robusta]KAH8721876.1 hypothetical protein BGZ61DRAFT_196037 [Ilyonectria robusta]